MAFEEHKNRKLQFGNPYADYEYYGKHSRRTWPSLVFSVLIGLGLCYLAWQRWQALNLAEVMGGSVSITSIEWGVYKLSGKWGVAGLLVVLGVGLAWLGIYNYRRLENMKAD
ncbi:hypothetical protein [Mucilaginibacter sp. CSA2-8R]|uniref:hypothetical protein n=1 Tax=Mucilaginibacter sp. CSA2-8R TaxID=3141542 RepID=UPI00315DAE2E